MKLWRARFYFLLMFIAVAVSLTVFFSGRSRVDAQNAGNTGTATVSVPVVYNVSTGISQVFPNIGQSAHYLNSCATSWNGSVTLQGSFDGATNWTTITYANYLNGAALTGCFVLQAGGYYQNIRAVAATSSGTFSSTYNASSGPISFAPTGISSNGPSSPTACNKSVSTGVNNGATVLIFTGDFAVNSLIRVCAYDVSLAGNGSGFLHFQESTNSFGCTSAFDIWVINSTGNSNFPLGSGMGQLFSTGTPLDSLCFTNNSGQTAQVSYSYAIVPLGF